MPHLLHICFATYYNLINFTTAAAVLSAAQCVIVVFVYVFFMYLQRFISLFAPTAGQVLRATATTLYATTEFNTLALIKLNQIQ